MKKNSKFLRNMRPHKLPLMNEAAFFMSEEGTPTLAFPHYQLQTPGEDTLKSETFRERPISKDTYTSKSTSTGEEWRTNNRIQAILCVYV